MPRRAAIRKRAGNDEVWQHVSLPGCRVIGGIFKAGVGVGVILSIIVVGLLFALVTKTRA